MTDVMDVLMEYNLRLEKLEKRVKELGLNFLINEHIKELESKKK